MWSSNWLVKLSKQSPFRGGLSTQDYDSTVVSAINQNHSQSENCLKPDYNICPFWSDFWTHLTPDHTALLSVQQDVEHCGPEASRDVLATRWQSHTPSLQRTQSRAHSQAGTADLSPDKNTHTRSDTTGALGSANCHELFGSQRWHRFVIATALIFSAQHLLSKREAWTRTGA